MDDVERQRTHFESISGKYLRARQQRNHLCLKQLLWQYFFEANGARLLTSAKVLEPMCGYSEGKAILEAHLAGPFHYTGFDFSRPLVDEAKARYPGANIFVGDVTQFDVSGEYDLVILIGGLHHVYAHADNVLCRLSQALRPGGYFINFEPTHDNRLFSWIRGRIYRSNPLFDAQTERAFELTELNRLYRGAGLTVVDQVYPGLLAYVLYYNPDAFPRLNLGGEGAVRWIFKAERSLYRAALGRKLSFATLSLLQKPESPAAGPGRL